MTDPFSELIDKANSYKKQIDPKKGSGSEYQRVKIERDNYASEMARKKKEEEDKIRMQAVKKNEVDRIKAEMKKAVDIYVVERVAKGEAAISDMFTKITLDNISQVDEKLNTIKPSLKDDEFKSAISSPQYNSKLVTKEEFLDLCNRAYKHFNFDSCNKVYQDTVRDMIDGWRKRLPALKIALQQAAKAQGEEKELLERKIKEKNANIKSDLDKQLEESRKKIESEADNKSKSDQLKNEFDAQVQTQSLSESRASTRKSVYYRFDNDTAITEKPGILCAIMNTVILHCVSAPEWAGAFQRNASKFIKKNDKGESEYIPAIESWLKMLSKLPNPPDIEGLQKIEEVTTIAKA